MLTHSIFRGSLRGFAIPHCPPLHLHVQQPQPLINLRSFSARGGLTSVLVRAQSATFAERSRPAVSSFEQLGLGEELLSFLSEQKLTTPTEIQVGAFYGACLMHHFEALASAGFHVLVVKVQEEESTRRGSTAFTCVAVLDLVVVSILKGPPTNFYVCHAGSSCFGSVAWWRCIACVSHWFWKDLGLPPATGAPHI
jgi:hypothetical protein